MKQKMIVSHVIDLNPNLGLTSKINRTCSRFLSCEVLKTTIGGSIMKSSFLKIVRAGLILPIILSVNAMISTELQARPWVTVELTPKADTFTAEYFDEVGFPIADVASYFDWTNYSQQNDGNGYDLAHARRVDFTSPGLPRGCSIMAMLVELSGDKNNYWTISAMGNSCQRYVNDLNAAHKIVFDFYGVPTLGVDGEKSSTNVRVEIRK
jgi:hypothetical protein